MGGLPLAAGSALSGVRVTLAWMSTRRGLSGRAWYLSQVLRSTGTVQAAQQVSSQAGPMQWKLSA